MRFKIKDLELRTNKKNRKTNPAEMDELGYVLKTPKYFP